MEIQFTKKEKNKIHRELVSMRGRSNAREGFSGNAATGWFWKY
jgi:hypothetical protein